MRNLDKITNPAYFHAARTASFWIQASVSTSGLAADPARRRRSRAWRWRVCYVCRSTGVNSMFACVIQVQEYANL